jgi:hypothetical protein
LQGLSATFFHSNIKNLKVSLTICPFSHSERCESGDFIQGANLRGVKYEQRRLVRIFVDPSLIHGATMLSSAFSSGLLFEGKHHSWLRCAHKLSQSSASLLVLSDSRVEFIFIFRALPEREGTRESLRSADFAFLSNRRSGRFIKLKLRRTVCM